MRLNFGHSSALGVAALNRLAQGPAATGMSIDTAIEALTRERCRMDSDMAGHIQVNFDDLSTLLDHLPCVLPDGGRPVRWGNKEAKRHGRACRLSLGTLGSPLRSGNCRNNVACSSIMNIYVHVHVDWINYKKAGVLIRQFISAVLEVRKPPPQTWANS